MGINEKLILKWISKGIRYEGQDLINLAQNRDKWQTGMDIVLHLPVL